MPLGDKGEDELFIFDDQGIRRGRLASRLENREIFTKWIFDSSFLFSTYFRQR